LSIFHPSPTPLPTAGRLYKREEYLPLWERKVLKKINRGPNWKDGRGEEVLERHLLNIGEAPQAIITARLFCEDAYT